MSFIFLLLYFSTYLAKRFCLSSLLGAFAVVAGLYIVLWGKAGDVKSPRAAGHADDLEKTWSGSQLLDAESTITAPLLADKNPIEK